MRIRIDRIAAGGDGVGRMEDGLTVFVPRTAPGDVAAVALSQRKRRYARGLVETLETASSDRLEPPCPHYRDQGCGGCQLQHVTLQSQLDAKRRIVGDALRRIGRREVADPPIVGSPEPWRYRSTITLAVQGANIGLHRFDRPDAVFMLDDCLIARESIMNLWQRVRQHRHALPPTVNTLVLREDRDGGLHVIVKGSGSWDARPLADAIGDAAVSYWWAPHKGAARVLCGARPGFPALAFEQASPVLAGAIRRAAAGDLGDIAGECVWDLYGGVGDTAAELAQRGALVWTVDSDRSAVEWAKRAGARCAAITRLAAKVEESLHRLPEPAAIVVNPPRIGMHARVSAYCEQWAQRRARAGSGAGAGKRLAYISCDPATLARDIARMPALQLRSVTAYDAFPQTSHVEVLAVLEAS